MTMNRKQPGLQIVTMEFQNQTVPQKPIISKTKMKNKSISTVTRDTLLPQQSVFARKLP